MSVLQNTFFFPHQTSLLGISIGYGGCWWLWQRTSWVKGGLWGVLFGIAFYSSAVGWLADLIQQYHDEEQWIALVVYLAILLCLALFFAVAGGLASFLFHRLPFAVWSIVGVPTAFTLVEWTREWILTGLVWFLPAHLLLDAFVSAWYPIFGALGVSALFWVALGSLVYLLVMPSLSRLFALTTAGVLFFFLSQQLGQHSWTSPTQESLSVRIVHSQPGENEKSRPSVIQKIRRYQSLSSLEPIPELSVWPESSMSLPFQEVGKYVQGGFEQLSAQEIRVLYGGYWKDGWSSYNTILTNQASPVAYIKQHLIPFGEYRPAWFVALLSQVQLQRGEDTATKPSPHSVIQIDNIPILPSICFELLFPNEIRTHAAVTHLHVHLSDLSWASAPWLSDYLLNIARIRSLEIEKPMVYAVAGGTSAFLDEKGVILSQQRTQQVTFFDQRLELRQGATPFVQWGYLPLLSFFLVLLAFVGMFSFKEKHSFFTVTSTSQESK